MVSVRSVTWLSLLYVLIYTQSALAVGSTPAFWRVSDADSRVYLLGSIHFGDESLYPLPPEIEEAYRHSDALAVEVDINQVTPQAMSESLNRYAKLPNAASFDDALGTQLFSKFRSFCEKNGLSWEMFKTWQPWFVAVQLVQMELAKSEGDAAWGIDQHFLNQRMIPVVELETLDFQLSLFAEFSAPEQRRFLSQTLSDLSASGDYLQAMVEAWRAGNTLALETLMLDAFSENDAAVRSLFDKLFTVRNIEMTRQVEQFLADNREAFVVVGAGHMLGDSGMVAQLRKAGYQVERIRSPR